MRVACDSQYICCDPTIWERIDARVYSAKVGLFSKSFKLAREWNFFISLIRKSNAPYFYVLFVHIAYGFQNLSECSLLLVHFTYSTFQRSSFIYMHI